MGHSLDMHKMAYRLHTPEVIITKVGKVLSALDSTAPGKKTALTSLRGTIFRIESNNVVDFIAKQAL